jgi:FKBP-type peptidyl-prolyl cis-trans isomerase
MQYGLMAFLVVMLMTAPVCAVDAPQTEEQKTLYAIGLALARSLQVFSLSPGEFALVSKGFADGHAGSKTDVDPAAYNDKVQELARVRRLALGERTAQAGREYLEKFVKETGAEKTASGMAFVSLREGSGIVPKRFDNVRVHYRGMLTDGKEFENTYQLGKPLEIGLDSAIPCWVEGLMKMKLGGRAKLVCPASLAYGEAGAGDHILPGATLIFEIELLGIMQ